MMLSSHGAESLQVTARTIAFVLVACPVLLAGTGHAEAATIYVDNTTCTLPDAVRAADTGVATGGCPAGSSDPLEVDTIILLDDVVLTAPDPSGDGAGVPIIFNGPLAIDGRGHEIARAGDETDPAFRFFSISQLTNGTTHLFLRNLTLRNGREFRGGAVHINGNASLTAVNVEFLDNTATGAGGAIYSFRGDTWIYGCQFERNRSEAGDGGAYADSFNGSRLHVENTEFIENHAEARGGAVSHSARLTPAVISGSTFAGNFSRFAGAAIYVVRDWAVSNCTFFENFNSFEGGAAIYVRLDGDLSLSYSTLSGNISTPNLGATIEVGASAPDFGRATFAGVVIADSVTLAGPEPAFMARNCTFAASAIIDTSAGNNFSDDTSCGPGFAMIEAVTDYETTLADNGGPTRTLELVPGGVAEDSGGDCSANTPIDQRGVARNDLACDAGAYEIGGVIPGAVPDGMSGTPLLLDRVDPAGTLVDVSWDASCPAWDYHLIHGDLASVSSYAPTGSACDLGTTGSAYGVAVPTPDLWFLMVGDDDGTIEGSWGEASTGVRVPGTPSFECGITTRDDAGVCP